MDLKKLLALPLLLGLHYPVIQNWISPLSTPFEICDNAIDDDNDGHIDLQDPDCACPVLEPVSHIPNPSFEEWNCCPESISQLHCAEAWNQASGATTDYLNTCGWMGWKEFPPPLPFPDGEGIVGFRDGQDIEEEPGPSWKEYAGACLLVPLKAGVTYRFQFYLGFSDQRSSPPLNVTFFGNADCKNLPFGRSTPHVGCPTNDTTNWVNLGSVFVSGNRNWVKEEITFTPEQDIHAIAIGPNCTEEIRGVSTYYFFDNLVLDEEQDFELQIQPLTHPCSENFVLGFPDLPNTSYQWYKEGVALIGATDPTLAVTTGEGNYQVLMKDDKVCKISRVYSHQVPKFETVFDDFICTEGEYLLGNQRITEPGYYEATLTTSDNCDSLVRLNLEVVANSTSEVEAKIFEGNIFQIGTLSFTEDGFHEIQLPSSLGCDSLVHLQLEYYKVYAPNVFSPNGDGINDYFNIQGEAALQTIRNLQVYDRWGVQVYEGRDLAPNVATAGWDGRVKGQVANPGVYVYKALIQMMDGQEDTLTGAVTVVR